MKALVSVFFSIGTFILLSLFILNVLITSQRINSSQLAQEAAYYSCSQKDANWIRCQNTKLKYSFEYPSNWYYSPGPYSLIDTVFSDNMEDLPNKWLILINHENPRTLEKAKIKVNPADEEFSINGYWAYKHALDLPTIHLIQIGILSNNQIYIFTLTVSQSSEGKQYTPQEISQLDEILNHMANSFTFE